MRLSSLADYAVVMMSAAARQCGVRGGMSGRLNATLLSDETGIPLPTVQKLVSRLSAAGLIESARGTGGGFRLSRPPASINLADIIEAVEGPIVLTACVDEGRHDCIIEENCRVKPHWNVVNGAVRGALASVSLASLSTVFPRERASHQSNILMGPESGGPGQQVLVPEALDSRVRGNTAEEVQA